MNKLRLLLIGQNAWLDSLFDRLYIGLLNRDDVIVHTWPFKSYFSVCDYQPPHKYAITEQPLDYDAIMRLVSSGYYDLIVVSSISYDGNRQEFVNLIQASDTPVVGYRNHDMPWDIDFNEMIGRKPIIEFRKEVKASEECPDDIFPTILPVPYVRYQPQKPLHLPIIPNLTWDKFYDVVAIFGQKIGHFSHDRRIVVVDAIRKHFRNCIAIHPAMMHYNDYREAHRHAWIAVYVRGVGARTHRCEEIAIFGSAMVAERQDRLCVHPFNEPDQSVHFSVGEDGDVSELIEKINALLADKERCVLMAEAAYGNAAEWHTIDGCAGWFMDILKAKMEENNGKLQELREAYIGNGG